MARKPVTPAVKAAPVVPAVIPSVPVVPPVATEITPMVELKDHELHVLHTAKKLKQIVSKRFYHDNSGELEVLQGEPGEPVPSPHIKMGVPVFKNKMVAPVVADKVSVAEPAPTLVPPPAL